MRSALSKRIARLEHGRSKQSADRTLHYNPLEPNGIADALRSVGKAGKYMLVPNFGLTDAWENALLRQQHELIAEARKRS